MSNKNYHETAQNILSLLGGEENVISVASCATRLRVVIKNEQKIQVEAIENLDLVKGSFNNGGQFQIILGTGIVDEVYREFVKVANISEVSKEELKEAAGAKLNVF